LIAVGSKKLGHAFNMVSKTERWARLSTGGLILMLGIWLTLLALLKL
jgi:cytochrome c-type biogenesis protein